jgi:hypothetical protein
VSFIAHGWPQGLAQNAPMSDRSVFLRSEAAKCRSHANALSDQQTQAELRSLADEYIVRAEKIEREEADLTSS